MCGRYDLDTHPTDVAAVLGATLTFDFAPRRELRPTDIVPIVRRGEQGSLEVAPARWMLVPRWAKEPSDFRATFNARAESLGQKPVFREAFASRRCIVPATGFYEWSYPEGQKRRKGGKKHRVERPSGQLLLFAGLWERWRHPRDGAVLDSCTIVTCDASPLVAAIHDRMPVVLTPDAARQWLDPATTPERLRDLMKPAAGDDIHVVALDAPRDGAIA